MLESFAHIRRLACCAADFKCCKMPCEYTLFKLNGFELIDRQLHDIGHYEDFLLRFCIFPVIPLHKLSILKRT